MEWWWLWRDRKSCQKAAGVNRIVRTRRPFAVGPTRALCVWRQTGRGGGAAMSCNNSWRAARTRFLFHSYLTSRVQLWVGWERMGSVTSIEFFTKWWTRHEERKYRRILWHRNHPSDRHRGASSNTNAHRLNSFAHLFTPLDRVDHRIYIYIYIGDTTFHTKAICVCARRKTLRGNY